MSVNARTLRSALLIAGVAWIALFPFPSSAHPMGNFSISHYAGIRVEGDFVEIRYFIDMAEIPTFQEMQQAGIAPTAEGLRLQAFLAGHAESLKSGLTVIVNGHPLPLVTLAQNILFAPGAGGLPTMKLGFVYRAALTDACDEPSCTLLYEDANFPGRAGWKEIVVTHGRDIALESSSVPSQDRSAQLSNYPTDLVNSAPQQLEARIVFSATSVATSASSMPTTTPQIRKSTKRLNSQATPGPKSTQHDAPSPGNATASTPVALTANQQATPRNAFTELMSARQIGLGFVSLAVLVAMGLGALHALEPGHGKTIVAAYLVGTRGTARHALALGLIVTASHTAGVYLLGVLTLYAQKYVLPDRIYPYLGVLSGVLIVGIGSYMFLQRYLGEGFEHHHNYEISADGQARPGTTGRSFSRISSRQLLLLGITGGIVPCPAALVVLLSSVALHRIGLGLFLIAAFSLGLAATLIAMGLLALYARTLVSGRQLENILVQRWLPLGSAAIITLLGFGIAVRGLMAAGIVQIHFWA